MSIKRKKNYISDINKKSRTYANDYDNDGYAIIKSLINENQLAELRNEADELLLHFNNNNKELAENGCAFDTMEDGFSPNSPVKVDLVSYLKARFEGQLSACSPEGRDMFKHLILNPLTLAARDILKSNTAYIFNEHFVIKPPHSHGRYVYQYSLLDLNIIYPFAF